VRRNKSNKHTKSVQTETKRNAVNMNSRAQESRVY